MWHVRPTLRGGARAADDGRRSVVTGLPKGEGTLPGFLLGPGGHVTGGAPPLPVQDFLLTTVG